MSSSSLVRWGALGALLAGLGFVVAGYFGWLTRGNDLGWAIAAIALIGAVGGVVGLHARQKTSYGRLGTTGFAAVFVGSTLALMGSVLLFLDASGGVLGGRVRLALVIGLVILGIGLVLLGVATLRTKVLPHWGGVVLIAAFPASASLTVSLSFYSGLVAFGLAWLALSYALRSERGEAVQRRPRQSK